MPAERSSPLRVLVFGATGLVGSQVVAEALGRGHAVTAVVRDGSRSRGALDGVPLHSGDASNPEHVARLSEGHDVVVSATRPALGREAELVTTARGLLAGLRGRGPRLVLVGGAASLRVPGPSGVRAIDDPRFVPPQWRAIAQACVDQLGVCEHERDVAWTYVSPPALLEHGERTGAYRSATNELVVDASGRSRISYADFAVAIVDELEAPRPPRTRFTVGY